LWEVIKAEKEGNKFANIGSTMIEKEDINWAHQSEGNRMDAILEQLCIAADTDILVVGHWAMCVSTQTDSTCSTTAIVEIFFHPRPIKQKKPHHDHYSIVYGICQRMSLICQTSGIGTAEEPWLTASTVRSGQVEKVLQAIF